MPGLRHVGAPSTVSVPLGGARKPAIMCRIVDLSAPFGPSSPVTPGPMSIVMSLTATTLPYQRLTLLSSILLMTAPLREAGGQAGQGEPDEGDEAEGVDRAEGPRPEHVVGRVGAAQPHAHAVQ